MRIRSRAFIAFLCLSLTAAATAEAAKKKPAADPRDAPLAELAKAVGCPSDSAPQRVWCVATDGWAKGTAAALADGDHVLLGLTIELQQGKSVDDAIQKKVSVSALALRVKKGKVLARLTNVMPESAAEEQMVGEAVFGLAAYFKRRAETATAPKDLYDYVQTLPPKADHAAKPGKLGWTFSGASAAELRRVGDDWVVIEVPAKKDGVWVTIFTEKLASQ